MRLVDTLRGVTGWRTTKGARQEGISSSTLGIATELRLWNELTQASAAGTLADSRWLFGAEASEASEDLVYWAVVFGDDPSRGGPGQRSGFSGCRRAPGIVLGYRPGRGGQPRLVAGRGDVPKRGVDR